MALAFNLPSQIVVQTAAQWAVDATVYSNKRILVTSDEYYGSTDQRKFKIADGTQTWSNLDYMPIEALTVNSIGAAINGATSATPNDTDLVMSVDTSVAKKNTWTQVKAFLKTYFDTVYQAAGTYLTSANITQTIANGVTDKAPSEDAVFDALALKSNITDIRFKSDDVLMREALGSAIIASSFSIDRITNVTTFVDGRIYFSPIYIREATTINGVKWYQATQGNYTADNYNGVGLYSYSGGVITLVASTTNDGDIWKATANTISSKAFSSTYNAAAGLYFVAVIWNFSANVATPTIGAMTNLNNAAVSSGDFTNSGKLYYILGTQTALPSPTQAMSGLTGSANTSWLAVY